MNSKLHFRVLNFSVLLIILLFLIAAFANKPGAATAAQGPERGGEKDSVTAETAKSQNVTFIGQLGGSNRAVDAQGNYAYIGEGPRLTVFDVSNKANPVAVGRTAPLPNVIWQVKVVGEYAYVAAGYSGLRIINIANSAAPAEVASLDTSGFASGVDVAGDYAYVADGGYGLRIIDISNPKKPVQVGITPPKSEWVLGVAVSGDYAFLATEEIGLAIFDISDPTAPTQVSSYITGGEGSEVEVDGDTVYIEVTSNTVKAIDISDLTTPTLRTNFSLVDYCSGLVLEGNTLYIGDGNRLRIFDVTDPDAPSAEGDLEVLPSIYDLASDGSHIYAAGSGLHIIDVSDLSNLAERSFYRLLLEADDVATMGDYAFVASGWDGLSIVDISVPGDPILKEQVDTPGIARGVAAAGNYVYVADAWTGLRIINVSDPTKPVEASSVSTPGSAYDVFITGNAAYIADYNRGLRIIDITNPSAPSEAGHWDTPGNAHAVAVAGGYAYVADGEKGLRIIDVSNPGSLSEAGYLDTPGRALDVTVAGDYAYLADEAGGLHVIDIAAPTQPVLEVSYDTPGSANGVAVNGKHIYVADHGKLLVIDICDPTAPSQTGFYKTVGGARKVALIGNTAFVADDYGGLLIVKYTGPGSITINKQTDFVDKSQFNFDGDLGSFKLQSGASKVFPAVSSGDYDIIEAPPVGWYLHNVSCDSAHVAQIEDGVTIMLKTAEDITCTFDNRRLAVVADAGGPYVGDEGAPIALDASASSNIAMIKTYKWDCTNDGTWDIVASSPVGNACTYADNGSYTIKLRAWDSFSHTSTAMTQATVNNVAPQANAGSDQSAVAGAKVRFAGSFSDPGTADTHTITWDFGDGNSTKGTLIPVHTYSENGQYTVTLTVTDDDGGTDADSLTVDVISEGPTLNDISVNPSEVDEGDTVMLSGSMAGDGQDSMLTLSLSWGDGMTETHDFAAGTTTFSLPHIYQDDQPTGTPSDINNIDLRLSDASGTFTTTTAVVKINNVPPEVDAGADRQVPIGLSQQFTALITDPGSLDTHIASWDFGDGTVPQDGISVSHAYDTAGVYTVAVSVQDDDGGITQDTLTVEAITLQNYFLPFIARP